MLNTAIPLVFLTAACIFDFKKRRIPNEITYFTLISGMAYSIFLSGIYGFKVSILACAVVFILLSLVSSAFKLGGGDVKLMAGCGAWLGPQAPYFVFFALLFMIIYNLSSAIKNHPKGLILALKSEVFYGESQAFGELPGAFFITAGFIASKVLEKFI